MAWLAKLKREDWSFGFVLIDVINKTELTEWTEFRLVSCQRLNSVDSVNSVQIHEARAKQSKGSAIGGKAPARPLKRHGSLNQQTHSHSTTVAIAKTVGTNKLLHSAKQ